LLTDESCWSYQSGAWTNSSSTSFSYDNSGRILKVSSNINSPIGADYGSWTTYYYEGELMKEAIVQSYYHVLSNNSKTSFEYEDGRVSKKIRYNWQSGNWVEDSEQQYEYIGSGNLVGIYCISLTYAYSYKIIYVYEGGRGNYRQAIKIMSPGSCLPGEPTPIPVK
jgi:hypothetical protein